MTNYNIFSPLSQLSQSLDIIARHERGEDVSNVSQERLKPSELEEIERQAYMNSISSRPNLRYAIGPEVMKLVAEVKRLQAIEAPYNRHRRALRKIVCLNVPIPDEVFNLANDALGGADTQ